MRQTKLKDLLNPNVPTERHEDSGFRCAAGHYDRDGNPARQCIKCSKCQRWIRPENWDGECDGSNDWMFCDNCGGSAKTTTKTDDNSYHCSKCGEPWNDS